MIIIVDVLIAFMFAFIIFVFLYKDKIKENEILQRSLLEKRQENDILEQRYQMTLQQMDHLRKRLEQKSIKSTFRAFSKETMEEFEKVRSAVSVWLTKEYPDSDWMFLRESLGPYAAQSDPVRVQVRVDGKLINLNIKKAELFASVQEENKLMSEEETFKEWFKDYYPTLLQMENNKEMLIPNNALPSISADAFEAFLMSEGMYSSCIRTEKGFLLETSEIAPFESVSMAMA